MILQAVDSAVPAENAPRFQQPLGKPFGFPTDSTATTTTRYSWCPPKRGRSEVPDSLRDLNPHRIILWVGPSEDEKVKLTQYYVVPGEPNEWMSETWQDIRFSIFVNLNEDIRFARVIGSRDGERLFEFHSYLSMRQPKIQPVDPDYAARRLEELERMAHA